MFAPHHEKAAAELKERVLSIAERELGQVTGLAEMYIGTMHGYCLDLLQRLVPEKFNWEPDKFHAAMKKMTRLHLPNRSLT